MSWRRQLAVASPVSLGAVARAILDAALLRTGPDHANALIRDYLGASLALATDSGTSALVVALKVAVPPGGVVGFPAFACVDLAAAALFAGVNVRLYDIDPETLGPDLASLERMVGRGVDAVVVSHLYGYPADVPAVRALLAGKDIPLIEDAAQAASATLDGKRLGTLGDISILSFGRGKGMSAGGGGAVATFSDRWKEPLEKVPLERSRRGWVGVAKTAVQWGLGRPAVYTIPSMIPGLHLGEMVYHPAGAPAHMSAASSSLLSSALAKAEAAAEVRRNNARVLEEAARRAGSVGLTRPLNGSAPGFLRFPLRDAAGTRAPDVALGVLRSYPKTVAEQPQVAPILLAGESNTPGALELRRTLFTLPTHAFVTARDLERMAQWIGAPLRPSHQ